MGSPKGTHWISEIVEQLLAGKAEYSEKPLGGLFLEAQNFGEAGLDDMPSPRNMNTHLPFRMLPLKHIQLNARIIRIMRNPKDVAVSWFHHSQKDPFTAYLDLTWEEFMQKYIEKTTIYGSWFDFEKDWEKVQKDNPDMNILTLHYENLKLNTEFEITKIADFLGVEYTGDLIRKITEKVDFKNMSKEKIDITEMFSIDKKPYVYRKGQIGDWKNWFTVSQNEIFDALYEQEMRDSKLKFIFS